MLKINFSGWNDVVWEKKVGSPVGVLPLPENFDTVASTRLAFGETVYEPFTIIYWTQEIFGCLNYWVMNNCTSARNLTNND